MLISKSTYTGIVCAAVLMAMPMIASARPKPASTQMEKKSLQLDKQVKVDGKTLAPGNYGVLIEGKKVTFENKGQTVLTAPCDWKTLKYKSRYDDVVTSSNNVLQEIDFRGSNQALEVM